MGFIASPRNNRDLHWNLLLNIRIANLLFLWVDLKPRQKPDSKQKLYIGIKVSEKGYGYFHTYECCTHSKKMAATLLCVYITSQLAELQIKWNSRRRNSDCCGRFLVSSIAVKKLAYSILLSRAWWRKLFYIFIYIVVVYVIEHTYTRLPNFYY